MTTIIYKIVDNEPYLTAFKEGRADSLEIRIDTPDEVTLHLGNTCVNIKNGVGRVKLSTLCDGVITPEVVFRDRSIFLYPIRLLCGKIMIAHPYEIYADLGKRAVQVRGRVQDIETELAKLKNAVYGKAIF